MMLYADDNDFYEKVIKSDNKILIDFFAEWCSPCQKINPFIEEIAQNYNVCKINVDTAPKTAQRYNIQNVPTLIIMQNGEIEAHHIGYADKNRIISLLTEK